MAKYPWRPTAVCACHAAGRWPGDFFNGDHRAIAASGVAIAHMSSRQRRLSSCSLLPISSVILRVGQDVIKTEDSLRLVVYPCGQTILLRSEEHTSELQSRVDLVCRLLLEKKKKSKKINVTDEDDISVAHHDSRRQTQ